MSTTSTFSGSLSLNLILTELLTGEQTGDLSLVPAELRGRRIGYASGTGYTLKGYRDKQDGIAASQTVNYDLIGTLTDKSGNTINMDVVEAVIVVNRSASGGDLTLGPTSGAAWLGILADVSDRLKIPAGGFVVWRGPSGTVSAGSDGLSITTPGSGSAYAWDFIAIGRDNT
jgi:hypothetical protein